MITYTEAIKDADGFILYLKGNIEIEGCFTNARVDRNSLPAYAYAYDLREGDNGEICSIEKNVVVNHAGTFLCKEPIDLGSKGYLVLGENEENDYSFF